MAAKQSGPTIVKKYANRRLYDTGQSQYITMKDLYDFVQQDHDFKVVDAKTGEDLTRSVLAQIVVDKESSSDEGETLLPTSFLKQMIGFYGDAMQPIVPNYLEHSLQTLLQNQEHLRNEMSKSFQGMLPNQQMQELAQENLKIFETAMKTWADMSMRSFGSTVDRKDKAS